MAIWPIWFAFEDSSECRRWERRENLPKEAVHGDIVLQPQESLRHVLDQGFVISATVG